MFSKTDGSETAAQRLPNYPQFKFYGTKNTIYVAAQIAQAFQLHLRNSEGACRESNNYIKEENATRNKTNDVPRYVGNQEQPRYSVCTSPVSPPLPEFIFPHFYNQSETLEGSLEHNLQTSQARHQQNKRPSVIHPSVSRKSNAQLLQSQVDEVDVISNHEQARCINCTLSFSPPEPSSSLQNQTTDQGSPTGETADFELEELEQSAKTFKHGRIRLGFSQKDVSQSMGKYFGICISQTIISRFEGLNLSYRNTCKYKPLMEKWLNVTQHLENSLSPSPNFKTIGRRRRKRTIIGTSVLVALEKAFDQKSYPTWAEIRMIAEGVGMDNKVAQTWFRNRRAKEKTKINQRHGQAN